MLRRRFCSRAIAGSPPAVASTPANTIENAFLGSLIGCTIVFAASETIGDSTT